MTRSEPGPQDEGFTADQRELAEYVRRLVDAVVPPLTAEQRAQVEAQLRAIPSWRERAARGRSEMRRRRLREQRHNDQRVIDAKHERLRRGEPHMAPIVALVDEIAEATYGPGSVPYPDPENGGIHARALFLLQDPSRRASGPHGGSGLLSLDNVDHTAANGYTLYEMVGLQRSVTLHWNAVPWLAPEGATTRPDMALAGRYLARLVELLDELRVVVLLGARARDRWSAIVSSHPELERGWPVLSAPHPSGQGLAQQGAEAKLLAAFRQVAEIVAD